MKIRIEIEDGGMKSIHEFEGELLRDRIFDFLTAAGVFTEPEKSIPSSPQYEMGGTLKDRLEKFILYEFPDSWFSSNELRERYETVCDDIKLSTVSTYLSRMCHDGVLERMGNRNNRRYKLLAKSIPEVTYGVQDSRNPAI
jgi:hypothetical protein